MPVSDEFMDYVLDQIESLGEARVKRMFGGAGLFLNDLMFALIADDVLYLKTDASNRGDFESAGMGAFRPFEKKTVMPYHEVPAEVLEDPEELTVWARKAVEVSIRLSKKRKKGKKALEGERAV